MTAALWNAHFPVGTRVLYFPVAGLESHAEAITATEARVLGSGEVVVSLAGRAGAVSVRHLLAVPRDVTRELQEFQAHREWTVSHPDFPDWWLSESGLGEGGWHFGWQRWGDGPVVRVEVPEQPGDWRLIEALAEDLAKPRIRELEQG